VSLITDEMYRKLIDMKWRVEAVLVLVLSILAVSFSGCVETELIPTPTPVSTPTLEISINVYVKTDQPTDIMTYELMGGTPTEVGVYRFYLQDPKLAGSGVFEKIDTIPLEKINESTFYGEKLIDKINETLVIGYPFCRANKQAPIQTSNVCYEEQGVVIDQSKEEVNVTVHYWVTYMPPIPGGQ